jgi:hypothetical protein
MTALHVAIINAENFPNIRSIKEMLIQGADRNITDNKGKLPYEYIKDIKNEEIRDQLL